MKKVLKSAILGTSMLFLTTQLANAHFLLLKPSTDNVEGSMSPRIKLEAIFTHPMEGGPNMDFKIIDSGAVINGHKYPLHWKSHLIRAMRGSHHLVHMYTTHFVIRRPGVYAFYVNPSAYYEPEEQKFIKQITKVYVDAYGLEEGWSKPIGLKAEIIPLIKPFAIWEGNTFRGRVLFNGKPAANINVEVEYLNVGHKVKPPADPFITQVVKTDKDGYFEYTIPWAGWWGFSAIGYGGEKIGPGGKEYPIELDAVMWVKAYPKPKGVR